jgi:hypothetical protein
MRRAYKQVKHSPTLDWSIQHFHPTNYGIGSGALSDEEVQACIRHEAHAQTIGHRSGGLIPRNPEDS